MVTHIHDIHVSHIYLYREGRKKGVVQPKYKKKTIVPRGTRGTRGTNNFFSLLFFLFLFVDR